jgi:hypothetical protein
VQVVGSIALHAGVDLKDWERDHMADAVNVLQSRHMDAISAAASAATECVCTACVLLRTFVAVHCTRSHMITDSVASGGLVASFLVCYRALLPVLMQSGGPANGGGASRAGSKSAHPKATAPKAPKASSATGSGGSSAGAAPPKRRKKRSG